MKFIDDKGRLFGKINIIDFTVLVFLFSLIPMFHFMYKISTRQPVVEPKKDFIEVEINCNLIKVRPEVISLIGAGDKSFDAKSEQIGEITWVGDGRPFVYKFQIDSATADQPIIIADQILKELPVKIKLKAEIRDTLLYYNGQRILTDSPLLFETAEYTVSAVPFIPVVYKGEKERQVQVKVRFAGLFPELGILIEKGHMETDEDGRTIGLLKEVDRMSNSQIRVIDPEAKKTIFISDPYSYDIVVKLDLLVTDRKGELFYKNYSVKVGNQITFSSKLYTVSGLIVDIKEKDGE